VGKRSRPAVTAAPAPLSPARTWAFRLVSVLLLPLLLLALLEGGLRLLGVGYRPGFTVPCQVQGRPADCENPDFGRRFFPPGLARNPSPLVIPAQKGERTFRVFILGESAAQGDPEPAFGFGRYLEVMLAERHPGIRFEVINAGVVAINSHVMLPIARELAGKQGDLFVVYAGHNEVVGPFGRGTVLTSRPGSLPLIRASVALGATRVGQLAAGLGRLAGGGGPARWGGMEMFLGQQLRAGDPALEAVYGGFERNLADTLAAARAGGAQVVVSTVGSRLRDFAPLASLHRPGLAEAPRRAWEAHFAEAERLEAAGRLGEALAAWRAAEAIDAEQAELQYRLGRAALALGDVDGARRGLTRARDLDTLRFRADSRIDAIIRKVAAAGGPGVRLVDGAAALAEASPAGLPGGELFYEHVHLAPAGSHRLAAALLPAVEAALPGAWQAVAAGPGPLSLEQCQARLAFTGFDRYRVAKEVLARLQRPPLSGQSDHAGQVRALELERALGAAEPFEDSDAAYRAALAARPGDPWLHLDYGILLDTRDVFMSRRGGPDAGRSIEQYRLALDAWPQSLEARVRLAEALLRLGRAEEAVAQCRTLQAWRPRSGQAWVTMAWALLRLERYGEVREALQRAAAVDPPVAEVASPGLLMRLARALDQGGRSGEARRTLDEAIAAWRLRLATDPASPEVLRGLAEALRVAGQAAEADALEARAAPQAR
jgi:tetratricopeptide (TPR) repeat protein